MAGIAPRPAVFNQTAAPSCLLQFKKLQQLALNSLILKGVLNASTFFSLRVHFLSLVRHSPKVLSWCPFWRPLPSPFIAVSRSLSRRRRDTSSENNELRHRPENRGVKAPWENWRLPAEKHIKCLITSALQNFMALECQQVADLFADLCAER
jgi:hypothetical protein